ncbi:MAG: hypothetical protein JXQ29_07105 [Planctomycetes bacterium]|nr:hypothetical protein [Planctomycetota bacterium]
MRLECPGCGESTPEVVAEGGKPVYCTQCGRGYRFVYGFYHRYIYFVFNHPFLTYSLLLVVALLFTASSYRGSLKLLYLTFFTVFYWACLRWVQRSSRYLEQLPTGPGAVGPGAFPPRSLPGRPAAAVHTVPVRRDAGPRLSLFAVFVFLVNLCVFPLALLAGLASLGLASELLLDLVHSVGWGPELVRALAATDLPRLRTGVAIYFTAVLLTALVLFALNILAFSVVRARRHRGKELVVWALVFWLVSTALLGAQLASGIHLITGWQAQARMVRDGEELALNLDREPLHQWTLLHAWRGHAGPGEALLFYTKVLDRSVVYDARHAWMTRGLAMRLAAAVIRDQARAWSESDAERKARFVEQADDVCLRILAALAEAPPDPALQETARDALRELGSLPFALPRSEKRLVEEHLFPATGRASSPPAAPPADLGRGSLAVARCLQELVDPASAVPAERLGALLAPFGDRDDVLTRLLDLHREAARGSAGRRIVVAASFLASEKVIALLREALDGDRETRYRGLQGLYRIYERVELPVELARVRRYYVGPTAGRYGPDPSYERIHRVTARAWQRFLADRADAR